MSCLDCNDCNQSPIYPVNTALPGPPGASAFVYVAFATTVNNIGTPISSSASGFANNQPNANSAFIAIITTNTPFPGNPPASAFNGYWVPLQGVTVSGINLQDDNNVVGGGPFTTLDFRGAGLTGVTVTNAGAGEAEIQITTAGFIKTSYADLAAIVAGSTLNPGAYYWIVDAGDAEGDYTGLYKPECSPAYYTGMLPANIATYPHNAGIIVRASSTNQFEASAIYLARVPASTVVSSIFILNNNYNPGAKVVSYGQVFECIALAPISASIEPADDPANWNYIARDLADYVTEAQSCLFEFTTQILAPFGRVRARWDNKGNYLKNTNSTGTFNEGLKKIFRWGLSSVNSNQINFYDDSTRRLTADTKRSPSFNISNTNYCNIYNFSGNHIDTNLAPGSNTAPPLGYSYGTRFINVFMNSNGEITNNVFDNAAIGKIFTNNNNNRVRLINNRIENSVLYNVNFALCQNNNITNNSVIGDIVYKANDVYSQNSNYALIEEVNYTTVTTAHMQYGAGSKTWFISSGTGTVTPSAPNTILSFPGATTYAQTTPSKDIIGITQCIPNGSLVGTYHEVQAIPSASDITISGVYVGGAAGSLQANIYSASIATSFTSFSNNVIDNSVIRGLNKNLHGDQCWFVDNTITRCFIENQAPRIPAASVPNAFFNEYSYSDPGLEFGCLANASNEDYAFSRNNISDSVFLGNKINNVFTENEIKNSGFYSNAPSTNPVGSGFNGEFKANYIDGERGQQALSPINLVTGISGVRFTANNFGVGSKFNGNTLRKDVLIYNVTLEATAGAEAGAVFRESKFEGNSYFTTSSGLGDLTSSAGLYNMTFARRVNTNNNVFEGRQARWENFTVIPRDATDFKQSLYTTNLTNLTTRDFILTGTGKASPYNQLGPQYFGAQSNPIANIVNVVEGAPVATLIGAVHYKTATFTFTIETQFPHMINSTWIGKTVSLLLSGFGNTLNFIGPVNPTYPNGQYITIGTASIAGTITNIIDNYQFECTTVQNNSYYWLSSDTTTIVPPMVTATNPNDQAGNPYPGSPGAALPGCPSAASYVAANDTAGSVTPNYWFHQYQNKPYSYFNTANSSIISHNTFEPQVRIALNTTLIPSVNTALGGNRKFYVYRNWNTSANPLYDYATRTITLPHFFDVMSNTVVLGTSNAAVTYEVDVINNMPEDVLVRFVALPGCTVQFNLQPVTPLPLTTNRIIRVNNQATLTITSYFPATGTSSSFPVFDEIVLIRRGNYIKVDDRVIHSI